VSEMKERIKMETIIKIEGLKKSFKEKEVLRG
jgi:hypothetical protein